MGHAHVQVAFRAMLSAPVIVEVDRAAREGPKVLVDEHDSSEIEDVEW